MASKDDTTQTQAAAPVADAPLPSDKNDSASAPVPVVDTSKMVPLDIYLRIRQVPEWARQAYAVYPPAVGHVTHTVEDWDVIFKSF